MKRLRLFCWSACVVVAGCLSSAAIAQDAATATAIEPARFHHVTLNVVDPAASIRFYRDTFGGTPVRFRGVSDAVFTEKSFLLFNKVDAPADSKLDTGIWHIGWGGVDVKNEFEWWKKKGVEFHTPLTPLTGADNFYMYISGKDKELIEINTMGHHRFGHVHFFCNNVHETADWYVKNLGLTSRAGRGGAAAATGSTPSTTAGSPARFITCDNVSMIFYGAPGEPIPRWWQEAPLTDIKPTRGHVIDRIGFSYRKVEPVYERMKAAGVKILEPLSDRPQFKMKSFIVEGPNKVSIEIVEAKPVPEGTWD